MNAQPPRLSASRLALAGAAFLASGLAQAGPGPRTHAVGGWNLRLDDGSRQCRLMLRPETVGTGYGIGMPVGCHLAFPFLAGIKMWTDPGEEKLRFEDAKGQPVLAFEPGADGTLSATGPEGEALRLEPVGQHRVVELKVAAKGTAAAEPVAALAKPAAKLPLPTVADAAGHYSVLRKLGKDTGCMVTLDDKARGPSGSLKANLAPACRDQGIVIFDPVGWQFQAGQLVLTARKGHTARLDQQPDGTWVKETKDGASLALKKM